MLDVGEGDSLPMYIVVILCWTRTVVREVVPIEHVDQGIQDAQALIYTNP